jgi:hypothetical protein
MEDIDNIKVFASLCSSTREIMKDMEYIYTTSCPIIVDVKRFSISDCCKFIEVRYVVESKSYILSLTATVINTNLHNISVFATDPCYQFYMLKHRYLIEPFLKEIGAGTGKNKRIPINMCIFNKMGKLNVMFDDGNLIIPPGIEREHYLFDDKILKGGPDLNENILRVCIYRGLQKYYIDTSSLLVGGLKYISKADLARIFNDGPWNITENVLQLVTQRVRSFGGCELSEIPLRKLMEILITITYGRPQHDLTFKFATWYKSILRTYSKTLYRVYKDEEEEEEEKEEKEKEEKPLENIMDNVISGVDSDYDPEFEPDKKSKRLIELK